MFLGFSVVFACFLVDFDGDFIEYFEVTRISRLVLEVGPSGVLGSSNLLGSERYFGSKLEDQRVGSERKAFQLIEMSRCQLRILLVLPNYTRIHLSYMKDFSFEDG